MDGDHWARFDHSPRFDQFVSDTNRFIVGTKWMLGLLGAMAIVSFIVILAAISEGRKQTVDTIGDLRRQIEVIRSQNAWSIDDRRDLHESQGQIREALKRLESRK